MSTFGSGRAPRSSEHEALPNLKQVSLPARPRAVLEAMFAMCSVALEQVVTATLNDLEQQLFKLAEQAKSNEHQRHCFEILREIRRGRADVAPRFVIRLEAALASLDSTHEVPSFASISRSQRQELSLIEPEEMEESLALQEVASKADIRNSQLLFALGQRFGVLAGAPALEAEELPVGPYRLCECLRHAAACLDIQLEHRVLLFRAFDRVGSAQFGRLFEQLNQLCIEHRVLPNLQLQLTRGRRGESAPAPVAKAPPRTGARSEARPAGTVDTPEPGQDESAGAQAATGRAAPANPPGHPGGAGVTGGAPQAGEGDAAAAMPDPRKDPRLKGLANPMTGWPGTPAAPAHTSGGNQADARDLELFETMRDLMAGRRRALGLNPPPGQENAHTVRTEDVQSVLSALQSKPAPPMMIGGKMVSRSISHLKQDLVAQLRQITPDGKPPKLAETDGDTIDLMGMLFDHLGKDAKADSAAQQLMTRLQIPLLRVALRDKSSSPGARTRRASCSTRWPRPACTGSMTKPTIAPWSRRCAWWSIASPASTTTTSTCSRNCSATSASISAPWRGSRKSPSGGMSTQPRVASGSNSRGRPRPRRSSSESAARTRRR